MSCLTENYTCSKCGREETVAPVQTARLRGHKIKFCGPCYVQSKSTNTTTEHPSQIHASTPQHTRLVLFG
jgi:hypothetical protein